jgi:hypothetical protein
MGTPGIWNEIPGGAAGAGASTGAGAGCGAGTICTCASETHAKKKATPPPKDRRTGLTPLPPVLDVARRFIVW